MQIDVLILYHFDRVFRISEILLSERREGRKILFRFMVVFKMVRFLGRDVTRADLPEN